MILIDEKRYKVTHYINPRTNDECYDLEIKRVKPSKISRFKSFFFSDYKVVVTIDVRDIAASTKEDLAIYLFKVWKYTRLKHRRPYKYYNLVKTK